MIKSLIVKGLHNRFDFDLTFNEDLNIITGKNGSGKTTVLKIMWYLLGGRTDLLYKELDFSFVKLTCDNYSIETEKGFNKSENRWFIDIKIDGKLFSGLQLPVSQPFPKENPHIQQVDLEIIENSHSLFFPTFRRIEGGFGISQEAKLIQSFERNHLSKALSEISNRLSYGAHNFVTAISTRDIQELLVAEYYERLEKADKIQKTANQEIADQLKSVDNEKAERGNTVINELKEKMNAIEKKREELMLPFESLSNTVSHFFHTKGIEISDNISFGEKTDLLSSDKLSAGEKQMLSFLSYNAFTTDSSIFIDEPELSLHVDWQRQLLPTLMKQGTKNQFFIATHSPFIYGMYPDKEIQLIPNTQSILI